MSFRLGAALCTRYKMDDFAGVLMNSGAVGKRTRTVVPDSELCSKETLPE